jgi:hypothetical protein
MKRARYRPGATEGATVVASFAFDVPWQIRRLPVSAETGLSDTSVSGAEEVSGIMVQMHRGRLTPHLSSLARRAGLPISGGSFSLAEWTEIFRHQ